MDKQTKLMLKHGPKDVCWAANWGEKDQPLLEKYFTKAATLGTENNPMIIDFFDCLERAWNDHAGNLTLQNGTSFSVIDIAKTSDLPTIQGLQYCCRQIITSGLSPWRYHGVGSDNREPRAYQHRLYGETEPRADMTVVAQGSATRVNQSMRFIGIFPPSFPTITVRESAVFTNVTAYTGIMLNRQVFSGGSAGAPITHTVNVAPFTVATDVNFTPVTTWG
jgi:hypothetical protein